jgi:hypothetical protein
LPAPKWGARRFQYGAICRLGQQYERLLRQVPKQQILPLALDDMTADPRAIYLRSLEFLGVADDGRIQFPIENRARRVRWPALNRAQFKYWEYTRNIRLPFNIGLGRMFRKFNIVDDPRPRLSEPLKKELREYFISDVQILQKLLNRDLSHWLIMA